MYYTAPGHQHVQLLVAPKHRVHPDALPAPPTPSAMEPVIRQALNAALGGRGTNLPGPARILPAVRAHIRAQQRTRALAGRTASTVRVVTCHARDGGEFFGTVDADSKRLAYVARVEDGKLVSFKVL